MFFVGITEGLGSPPSICHGDVVEIHHLPLVICERCRRLGLLVVDELDHSVEDLLLGETLHLHCEISGVLSGAVVVGGGKSL
jgi:hypothetical protein